MDPRACGDSTFSEFVANLQVCLKRSYVVNCQFFATFTTQFCPVGGAGGVVNPPYDKLHNTTMI